MNKLLLLISLVSLASVGALVSCNYKPPSKAWKEVINQDLRIETLYCKKLADGNPASHCHLEVTNSEPLRYIRVSKPMFRDYVISIVTPGADKSAKTETGMICANLQENQGNNALNGSCYMEDDAAITEQADESQQPHAHIFRAWTRWDERKNKWIVHFSFTHDEISDRHNGNGHTE